MDKKGVGTVAVLVILGLMAGFVGLAPTYEHNVAVQESEPTTGVVQSIDAEVEVDDEGDESYNPVVVYEYEVDGDRFEGDNTFPGRFTRWQGSRSWAESVVDGYDVGQEVTVYYNPATPGQAHLRNDGWPGSWFFAAAYVLVAAVGGLSLIRTGFRRWNQRQLMANTPTERVRSLSVGRSELEGTARTGGREPMSAPFSTDDCVVASYEVAEYDEGDDA